MPFDLTNTIHHRNHEKINYMMFMIRSISAINPGLRELKVCSFVAATVLAIVAAVFGVVVGACGSAYLSSILT